MPTRTLFVACIILAHACGPGTGDATDTATTGGDSSSGGATMGGTSTSTTGSTGATTGAPTTGDTGGSTATTGTTGDTTTSTTGATTTSATTASTTGGQACEAIVGSEDCALLAEVSPDLELEQCLMCQGALCGEIAECDGQFPCVDGAIVLRGCCTDDQCEGLTPFCGMFIGINNICVEDDDR